MEGSKFFRALAREQLGGAMINFTPLRHLSMLLAIVPRANNQNIA